MKTETTNELDSRSGKMSHGLVKALINNYRENHMNAINETLGIEDAHSIWFDLPKLKNFIAMIEEEAGKANPDCSEEDLGIRFYYAAYPKAQHWEIMEDHPVPQEYAEKHTLVMIPTMKKEDEDGEIHDYDFNPLEMKNGGQDTMALNARTGKVPMKDDDDTPAENSGILIPPSPTKSEFF